MALQIDYSRRKFERVFYPIISAIKELARSFYSDKFSRRYLVRKFQTSQSIRHQHTV